MRDRDDLQRRVLATIQNYNLIQKGDKIVIGVSGGPDSMCLLNCLFCLRKILGVELVVAHINHMLREEAEEETKYVQEFCDKIDIPCFVKYADIAKLSQEQKLGTEEMGRKMRYEFFEEVAKQAEANKIATAHNSNDNAETVLMNLLRGSGISGLKGIEIKVDRNWQQEDGTAIKEKSIEYIRPILECDRAEIEAYCAEKGLNPKIDRTNLENDYTRNKIRNQLIPYLQKDFNPNVIQSLNRLSELAGEEEEYFKEIILQTYETLKIGENEKETILDLKKFNHLPKVIKARVLLYTINKVIGTTQGIGKVHIEDCIKLCANNIGNKYLTPNKNVKIFVKQGNIFVKKM